MIKDIGEEINMSPEQKPVLSSQPPFENKGVLPFATARQFSSPVITETPPPKPPEVKQPPEPPKTPFYKRLVEVLRKRAVHLGLAAGAIGVGVGGPALYHQLNYEPEVTLPSVGRDIASVPGFYWNFGKGIIEDIRGQFNKETLVPSTFTEKIDTKTLDHVTGKDGTSLDQLPGSFRITVSEAIFQATSNGTPVSQDQLSSILKDSIKPFDKETKTADVAILFPVENPADQKFTIQTIASGAKSWTVPKDESTPVLEGFSTSWSKTITIPKAGSYIIIPVDGAKVFRTELKERTAGDLLGTKEYFITVVSLFKGPDGTLYGLTMDDEEDGRGFSPDSILPALQDAPQVRDDSRFYTTGDPNDIDFNGKPLLPGTRVIRTAKDNARITLTLVTFARTQNGSLAKSNFTFVNHNGKALNLP